MANAKNVKQRAQSPERDSDNGQDGNDSASAGTNYIAEGQAVGERDVLTWAEFDQKVYQWELANQTQRITKVYFDGDNAQVHIMGVMSEFPVGHGKPSIRLSTGEIIEI